MSEENSVKELSMARTKVKRMSVGLMGVPSQTSLCVENGHVVQLIDKSDPIGQRENLLRIERHQKRIQEIKNVDLAKFSLNKRKLGEPENY